MYEITYSFIDYDHNASEPHTERFADLELFEMLERTEVIEWAHFNEKGQRTGGGSGMNAGPDMFAYDRI